MKILKKILFLLAPFIIKWISQHLSGKSQNEPISDGDKISGRVRHVVDGDSLYIDGYKPQIRLWGVDAPERDEDGYAKASQQLARFTKDQFITCKKIEDDKYGRTIGRCFLDDGSEINALMIKSGVVKEYLRFTKGYYGG